MATRVIIVRHGQSNYNAEKRIQGRSNASNLTEKGRADAEILGKTLSKYQIHGFYCSPLNRARHTAEIIQSCLLAPPQLQPTEDLMEVNLPLWENLTKDEVKTKYSQEHELWKNHPEDFKMTVEGEDFYSVRVLYQQAENFWRQVIPHYQDQTILIVAHNGINRCLIMSALGIPVSYYHAIQQSNCCINILNFSGELGTAVQLESLNQTAHLGIPIPPPRPTENRLRLLLVRHGETDWNREKRFQGIRDIPLNSRGKEQADLAAEFLESTSLDFAVTSPLARPKETAQMILKYHPGVKLDEHPDFQEICHGLWEGKLESEIEAEFPGLLKEWKDSPETVQMPEGENLQQVWDRAIAAWEEIVAQYSKPHDLPTGIVVAHDAVNKVILCYLLGLSPKDFWQIKQGNGAVSVIDYPLNPDSKPVLQAINLTTHLGAGIFDQTVAGAL